jgi:hypothetical protein
MRKIIDIDAPLLSKLKLISAFENLSVKALIEKAVADYVISKETEKFAKLEEEEKLDLGMLMLMAEADKGDLVSRNEIMDLLK